MPDITTTEDITVFKPVIKTFKMNNKIRLVFMRYIFKLNLGSNST